MTLIEDEIAASIREGLLSTDPVKTLDDYCHEGVDVVWTGLWGKDHPDRARVEGEYYAYICSEEAWGATPMEAIRRLAFKVLARVEDGQLGC